jgi:hypothetical protein
LPWQSGISSLEENCSSVEQHLDALCRRLKLQAEADLKEYKLKEYPKMQDPLQMVIEKMSGNTNLKTQLKEISAETPFAPYVKYIGDLERWGTSHSVQAMMPYDISVKNYFLR